LAFQNKAFDSLIVHWLGLEKFALAEPRIFLRLLVFFLENESTLTYQLFFKLDELCFDDHNNLRPRTALRFDSLNQPLPVPNSCLRLQLCGRVALSTTSSQGLSNANLQLYNLTVHHHHQHFLLRMPILSLVYQPHEPLSVLDRRST
jgi:hypothetical protein